MKAVRLESSRLIFKPLSTNHLSHNYVSWMNDSDVNQFLESGGDYTLEKLHSFLQEQQKRNILFWAIHLKEDLKHIGNIKIDPVDHKKKSGEYGILIGDRNEWGKGYATEASETIVDYCFKVLELNYITLGVVDKNINALKLYSKIGFREYKEVRGAGIYGGHLCNSIRMIKTNDR